MIPERCVVRIDGPSAVVTQAITDLVDADEELAQAALDDAVAAGGDPGEVDRRLDHLAEGQALAAAGQCEQAIGQYRTAWKWAQRAMS